MRGELESLRSPTLDRIPAEMRQPVPCIRHVPGIHLADVVGDQKRCGGEAEIGEDRIRMLGERCVAVVVRRAWCAEICKRYRPPSSSCQRGHLPRKDRTAHARDA